MILYYSKTHLQKLKILINKISFLLQIYLESSPKDGVGYLVSAKTHGATPLVMACRNGHYDVAEYLIEKCNADIEQPGSGIYF